MLGREAGCLSEISQCFVLIPFMAACIVFVTLSVATLDLVQSFHGADSVT